MLLVLFTQLLFNNELSENIHTEQVGFLECQPVFRLESIGLYSSKLISIYQMDDHFFLLAGDERAIFKLSNDGKKLESYKSSEGQGPGDFGKSYAMMPFGDGVAFMNNLNRQMVILDKSLNYVRNERIDATGVKIMAKGDGYWFTQLNGVKRVSYLDKDFRKKGEWFDIVGGGNYRQRRSVDLLADGVLSYQVLFFPGAENQLQLYAIIEEGVLSDKPVWETFIPPFPDEYTIGKRKGDYSPLNAIGGVGNIKEFKDWVVVNSSFFRKNDEPVQILDLFQANDGTFAGRYVADYKIIKSVGPDIFLYHDEKIFRVLEINP